MTKDIQGSELLRGNLNGDWTNPDNEFSNPITRAVRCTMEIEDLIFFKKHTEAFSLFEECKAKEAWNPSIGITTSPKTAEKATRICQMNFQNAQNAINSIPERD